MSLTPAETRTVIVGALLALFLAALDQTIVATALPSMAADLGGFDLISWVVTAYLLASVCATAVLGRVSDSYGRRPVLAAALLVFVLGSALCALAPNMPALILARGVQGFGGGGIIVLVQAAVADVVSPRERGRYAAYFSAVWAGSALLGPALGGVLAEHVGWEWIFWINLPLGLLALWLSDRALRKLVTPRRRAPVDVAGIVLLTAGTVALLLVLSLGGVRLAWTAPETLALAAVFVVMALLFFRRQRRTNDPLLPPRYLTDRVVGPVLATSFLTTGGYLAIAVLAPTYFQIALGVSVSGSGLLTIPLMVAASVAAALAGRYNRATGHYRLPPMIGLPVAVAALVVLALFAGDISAPAAATVLALVGLGTGPMFPCSIVAAQNAVPPQEIGTVSGGVAFSRSLGGAVLMAGATALVLGLVAGALPALGAVSSLEDLARSALPPGAREAVASAFAAFFVALAAVMLLGWAAYARIEHRTLMDRPASAD